MKNLYTAVATAEGGRDGRSRSLDGNLDLTMKPPKDLGWGIRHPDLTTLLEAVAPTVVMDQTWGLGQAIRGAAYTEPAELPDQVLTSIRCMVRVGEQIVVCTNRDGFSHPWPGGRREPGESHADTACREVMEETGWTVDAESLQLLGWLHMEKLDPPSPEDPFPYPDFLQYVYTGRAAEGPDGRDPGWTDTDGYELSSGLLSFDEAIEKCADDPLALAFLRLLNAAPVKPS